MSRTKRSQKYGDVNPASHFLSHSLAVCGTMLDTPPPSLRKLARVSQFSTFRVATFMVSIAFPFVILSPSPWRTPHQPGHTSYNVLFAITIPCDAMRRWRWDPRHPETTTTRDASVSDRHPSPRRLPRRRQQRHRFCHPCRLRRYRWRGLKAPAVAEAKRQQMPR